MHTSVVITERFGITSVIRYDYISRRAPVYCSENTFFRIPEFYLLTDELFTALARYVAS